MFENAEPLQLAARHPPASFTEGRRLALEQLADARKLARERGADPWEFAIELSHMVVAGLKVNDLRWLSVEGYAEHAVDVSQPEDATRRFRRSGNLGFPAGTCFVATAAGGRAVESLAACRQSLAACGPTAAKVVRCLHFCPAGNAADEDLAPSWDASRRTLRLGQRIVKRYHVPAPAQELILRAFEEEHWPPTIDDPLPPQGDQLPKRRLRTTLESLNRGQEKRLLWFRGDGTGQRIVWEVTDEAAGQPAIFHGRRRRAA